MTKDWNPYNERSDLSDTENKISQVRLKKIPDATGAVTKLLASQTGLV